MGTVVTLGGIVKTLAECDHEATIYAARPWTVDSPAVVAREPETGETLHSLEHLGLAYFLEVCTACEILADWEALLSRKPTHEQRCERVIHYAEYDA